MRENRGITLIALVVTIVVLLILAGVSISMLTGENGIITQAQTAKVETRGGAVEEARDLWKTNQKTDSFTDTSTAQTLDEVLTDLVDKDLLTEEERDEVEETGKVTIGSREIVFFELIQEYDKYELEIWSSNDDDILVINFLDIIELLKRMPNQKTDEEIFMLCTNEDMTFQEYMQDLYNKGEIDTIYTSLKDLFLSEGMSEEEYEEELNSIYDYVINSYMRIVNQDGTVYDGYYKIPLGPLEVKDYIFTIEFLNQTYKIQISIDEYEIVRDGGATDVFVYNIKDKEPIDITGGVVTSMKDNGNYEVTNYLEESYDNIVYLAGARIPNYTMYKADLICDEINVKGYFEMNWDT